MQASIAYFYFSLLPMHPIISTYITIHGSIPFIDDLSDTSDLSASEKELILSQAIEELAVNDKTKWTQLFTRFYENNSDLFWQFRALNASEAGTQKPEFHELWEQVVSKLRILEQILTDKMLKRDTDKTVTAFYDHVRLFFPYFDRIGLED